MHKHHGKVSTKEESQETCQSQFIFKMLSGKKATKIGKRKNTSCLFCCSDSIACQYYNVCANGGERFYCPNPGSNNLWEQAY